MFAHYALAVNVKNNQVIPIVRRIKYKTQKNAHKRLSLIFTKKKLIYFLFFKNLILSEIYFQILNLLP